MNKLEDIQNIYFVGIGGIGMSALARYMRLLNKTVCGYDKTPTTLTNQLIAEGISCTFTDAVDELPDAFKNIDNTLVVYTPAIPKENELLSYFLNSGFTVLKRAQLLGEVTKNTLCLAVAGTHGKTTTSAILGHY